MQQIIAILWMVIDVERRKRERCTTNEEEARSG
jgi:hypothetical protein